MSQDDPARDVGELLFQVACDPGQTQRMYATLNEFFHAMRNRLNSLKLGLYVGRRLQEESGRGDVNRWDEIERLYLILEHYFDQVHALFKPRRPQPMPLNLPMFLQEKVRNWRNRFNASEQDLGLVSPESSTAVFDPGMLGQALDQLAGWRLSMGGIPRILLGVEDGQVTLIWDEVGPPRGCSGAADPGDGSIALATLARAVIVHAGEIRVNRDRGFRVRMKWPINPCFPPPNSDQEVWKTPISHKVTPATPTSPSPPPAKGTGRSRGGSRTAGSPVPVPDRVEPI